MGSEKVAIIKSKADRLIATQHLLNDLKAISVMLEKGMFETDIQRIGVEQEISLIGNDWKPAPVLMDLLEKINDEHFTTEFAKFNMEVNLDPLVFTGDCLSQLEKDLWRFLAKGEKAAQKVGAHLLLAGIVPTLHYSDIDLKNITPLQRYHDLVEALLDLRGDQFEFRISGQDQWISRAENCFFESSNTSFQVHYQIDPSKFKDTYNWSLAISGPVMAISPNSPLLLGKRLWKETRIALFEQATDIRSSAINYREKTPRVNFGRGWAKGSVFDFYQENSFLHKLILRSNLQEDALKMVDNGTPPKLYGLNTHMGTIYNWNRPCYGITDGIPHIRIENRYLPSGPTVPDEVANAAFWLGLMNGMPNEFRGIHDKMDFGKAKKNFHDAARHGLDTSLSWPGHDKPISASELILKELLPVAKTGLEMALVDKQDIDHFLGIIEERATTRQTGSQWALNAYSKLCKSVSKNHALVSLTAEMSSRQQQGKPVHTWSLPVENDGQKWLNKFQTIEQVMETELFTVSEDDPIELVKQLMKWRNVRHIPVENKAGELTGMITCRSILFSSDTPITAKDVMTSNPVSVNPSMMTHEAIQVLENEKTDCLPVVMGRHLVGLVTERDFITIASLYLNK